LTGPQLNYATS
jgi:transposase InsO family protein